MLESFKRTVYLNYSYPDKFCPACVGRAARALAPKARAARPTEDILLSGIAAS